MSGYQDLNIGGRIGFLRQILLDNCQFKTDEQGNFFLKFFVGKNYEQNIIITEHSSTPPVHAFELSKASILIQSQFDDNEAALLSKEIRGSKAIKSNDFISYPSHRAYIDGRGFCFYSHIDGQKDHFKRQLLLQALAYAYLGAIECIADRLAQEINSKNCNIEELNQLYIEATKFNAILFFHQPVLMKNPSLCECWKVFDNALEVSQSAQELLTQLANVHYILHLDADSRRRVEEKEKQNKQEKWNLAFVIIGILIAIIQIIA
ncbi:hypothetical protein HPC40_00115 [Pasteurellaceae bacterium NCTC 11878]|nr:hypothetical protein [Spirabiliibacterium falconis]